jgi:cytochrome P450
VQTAASVLNVIYLMLAHPEVQEKAQEELDRVVGRQRLPDFSDRERLPYINAILKEILRWYPTTPLGIPHLSTEDDEYKGMAIPKSTLIVTNIW